MQWKLGKSQKTLVVTDRSQRQTLAKNMPQYFAPLGSQRDTYSDFTGALPNQVGQQAVDADSRQSDGRAGAPLAAALC